MLIVGERKLVKLYLMKDSFITIYMDPMFILFYETRRNGCVGAQ